MIGAERAFQQFPGLDLVEQLEQQNAKEHFARRLRQVVAIDDVPDQILADAVGGPIGVGELIGREHGIVGPGPRLAARSAEEDVLPFGSEAPIALIDLRDFGGREMAQNDRRWRRCGRGRWRAARWQDRSAAWRLRDRCVISVGGRVDV